MPKEYVIVHNLSHKTKIRNRCQPSRGWLKREAGANPARSRHCKGNGSQTMSLALTPGRLESADEPKSGDLPVLIAEHTYER